MIKSIASEERKLETVQSFIKERKIPTFFAIVQWLVTTMLQTDRLFFTYEEDNYVLYTVKILYLFLLLAAWNYAAYVILNYKNIRIRRGVRIFTIYFTIMLVILLFVWPGTWSWDDFWLCDSFQTYRLNGWQHIITEYYQMTLLQVLPFWGGIILLQNIIISVIVASVVTRVEMVFLDGFCVSNIVADYAIKLFPFLLPPIVCFQMSGYRSGLYVYLELLLVVELIAAINKNEIITAKWTGLVSLLTVIVACWRSEAIFYLLVTPLMILLVKKRKAVRLFLFSGVIIAISFFIISQEQKSVISNSGNGRNYEVVSTLMPGIEAIRVAETSEENLVSQIERVLNVDVIYENPKMNGEQLYWAGNLVKTGYSDYEYTCYMKSIIKLCLNHIDVVLCERINNALSIMRIKNINTQIHVVDGAATIYEPCNGIYQALKDEKWIIKNAAFKNVRRKIILLAGQKRIDGSLMWLNVLVWNSFIPVVVMIIAWFRLLVCRRIKQLFVYSFAMIKIPIIVATAPSSYFLYFLSAYMIGWAILAFWCLDVYKNIKNKRKYEYQNTGNI